MCAEGDSFLNCSKTLPGNIDKILIHLEDVDEHGNVIGYVRCVEFVINGKGISKITVTANDGSGKTATLTVTVK